MPAIVRTIGIQKIMLTASVMSSSPVQAAAASAAAPEVRIRGIATATKSSRVTPPWRKAVATASRFSGATADMPDRRTRITVTINRCSTHQSPPMSSGTSSP